MDASIGRGNLKDTDEENLSPSWILVDIVTVGENTVVCKRKPKLHHLLKCHVTTQGMELRMQDARYDQFLDVWKQLINTSMVAKSGMVLHGIAFSNQIYN